MALIAGTVLIQVCVLAGMQQQQVASIREAAEFRTRVTGVALARSGIPAGVAPLMAPRVAGCFAEGTPVTPEMLAELDRAMRGPFGDRYNLIGPWNGSGGPTVLTWSLVPDGVLIPSAGYAGEVDQPSSLFARMDSSFFSRATWIAAIQASFDRWSQVTGIRFQRVTDGLNDWDDGAPYFAAADTKRGDIRIGMKPIAATVVAYAYYPQTGDITLNSQFVSSFAVQTGGHRYLRNTMQHEIGHSIGLYHACPQNGTKIMEPNINNNFDGIQHDDVRAGQVLYGDVCENNSAAVTATDLGTLTPGEAFAFGTPSGPTTSNISMMGISEDSDVDYYRFVIPRPTLISASVTPIGLSYSSGVQNWDGNCSAGTSFNSALIQKLQFELRRSDQSVIGTSSGAGATTTLTRRLIPAGTYYVRVYSVVPHGFDNGSQLYTYTGNATRAAVTASSGFERRIDVSWATALSGATYELFRAPESAIESEVSLGAQSGTSYSDIDVVAGVEYRYRIVGTQPGGSPVEYEFGSGMAVSGSCPADFNSDGSVDDSDFVFFVQAYDALVVPPAHPRCDLTADLMVDDADFVEFVGAYEVLVCP